MTLTLAEAVKLTGKSAPTIRARIRDGKIPGAVRLEDGSYRIPQRELLAAFPGSGVTPAPSTPAPAHDEQREELVRLRAENAALRDHLRDLRAQLEHENRTVSALTGPGQLGPGPSTRRPWWKGKRARNESVPAPMEGPGPERGEA